jgi:hypothetical protein
MLRLFFILSLLLFFSSINAQAIKDSLLIEFYNKTIFDYFSDSSLITDQESSKCFLIFTKLPNNKGLITKNKMYCFKYSNNPGYVYDDLKKIPSDVNSCKRFYRISHSSHESDSVEITIQEYTTCEDHTKTKMTYCSTNRDSLPNAPTARFVFRSPTGK